SIPTLAPPPPAKQSIIKSLSHLSQEARYTIAPAGGWLLSFFTQTKTTMSFDFYRILSVLCLHRYLSLLY
ncbi:hypothetical protein, partial [[Ruminococcus] torques]|uniref:hypothetical protein n=1 Tax=[Ruminococcus] torques TaxID=33039 RepID=UPI003520321C